MTRAQPPVGVLQRYLRDVERHGFTDDPDQRRVAGALDEVLTALRQPAERGWFGRERLRAVPGLYIHGGVGRGKTYLMDAFYCLVSGEDKRRQHFHRFMQSVHAELKTLRKQENPLDVVAARIRRRARVICFDEFFVADIADAMILGTLFGKLFDAGITLVATSNVAPDDLYQDGLQRSRFLPAIDKLKQHTRVLAAGGTTDFRLAVLERSEIYHHPLDTLAHDNLCRYFHAIAPGAATHGGHIEVAGRPIPLVRRADSVAWFTFDALCTGPRGVDDYIELARCFQTVMLADVPVLDANLENEARRFIALIDEFYDRRVNLIVSAAVPLESLYTGQKLRFEFGRTQSRLREMQGHDYLAAPHRP